MKRRSARGENTMNERISTRGMQKIERKTHREHNLRARTCVASASAPMKIEPARNRRPSGRYVFPIHLAATRDVLEARLKATADLANDLALRHRRRMRSRDTGAAAAAAAATAAGAVGGRTSVGGGA